ncbi:MAG: glyoxalase [Alphaproteobacteria bacterium]|nr:glyoxalase [Alphaproteobacteria bacterium]
MSGNIIPVMRYRNAPRMLEWLVEAFGFSRHAIYEDGKGGIAHAQLTLNGGMVMLASARDDAFGKLQSTPAALGGTTQSPYIIVNDPDAAYERALAAGAKIFMLIKDEDYGGRGFICRDPEGHLWNFGSYDPWREPRNTSSSAES